VTKRQLMGRLNVFVREATLRTGTNPVTGGRSFTRIGWNSLVRYLMVDRIPVHLRTLLGQSQGHWTVEWFLLRQKGLPTQLLPSVEQAWTRLHRSEPQTLGNTALIYDAGHMDIGHPAVPRSTNTQHVAQDLIDVLFPQERPK
jgi:hypothetical protein